MNPGEAYELRRLALDLVILTPIAIAWGMLVRWVALKIADRWFR
jgi:hypothetical protein